MEYVISALISGVVAAALGVAILDVRRRTEWLRGRVGRRIVVHTTDERSLEGTVLTISKDGLVVASAVYLDAGRNGTPLAGDVWVPKDRIRFVQTVSPALDAA